MSKSPKAPPSVLDEEGAFTIKTVEQLKTIAHPLRQRLLESFAAKPRTTMQVAEQLSEKPTRLYHHVAALERAGLIRLVETRPKRGTIEKYYSAVAKRIRIDPRALSLPAGKLPIEAVDIGVGLVTGLFENIREEVADYLATESAETAAEEMLFVKVEVQGSAETISRYRNKVEQLIRDLEAESEEEDSTAPEERQRLVVGWYPLSRG